VHAFRHQEQHVAGQITVQSCGPRHSARPNNPPLSASSAAAVTSRTAASDASASSWLACACMRAWQCAGIGPTRGGDDVRQHVSCRHAHHTHE
jgi:hypothetical protein